MFWLFFCTVHLTECSCHVTYAFPSESKLYSCLNVKELHARNKRYVWGLSDYNWTWTLNHLVPKRTTDSLTKLTKWSSFVVNICLYSVFICMFLSCSVRFSEWIQTLQLPECQDTLCSKQAWYLKFRWLPLNLESQHLVHQRTLNYLATLAKWLSCVVSSYQYTAFDCMFLSCHVGVSDWIHTL